MYCFCCKFLSKESMKSILGYNDLKHARDADVSQNCTEIVWLQLIETSGYDTLTLRNSLATISSVVSFAFGALSAHNLRLRRGWHHCDGGALILIVSMRSTMSLNGCLTPRLLLPSSFSPTPTHRLILLESYSLTPHTFAKNETNPWLFQITFQYILAH